MADEVLTEGAYLLPIGGSFVNPELESLYIIGKFERIRGLVISQWFIVDSPLLVVIGKEVIS